MEVNTDDLTQALDLVDAPRKPGAVALIPAPMEKLREIAEVIANSAIANPDFQIAKVGDAAIPRSLAVAYQAARWGMDPMAVASQAYITPVKGGGEKMAYMAQLVAALVHRSPLLTGRLKYEFFGQGAQRYVRVTGKVKGVKQPLEYVSPTVGQIKVKNSPLWFTDPDQQLAYYGARSWARRHMQEALMGVYAVEEMVQEEVKIVDHEARVSAYEEPEESETHDAEFTDNAPEPSGGGGPQPQPESDASGGGESVEHDTLEADTNAARAELERILKLDTPEAVAEAWTALAGADYFKRVIAYDQGVATAIKNTIARHKKALVDGGAR